MIVSALWIVPAILGALDTLAQSRIWGQHTNWRAVLFTGLDWLLYGVITPFVFLLARRFPLTRATLRRNVAIHLAAALAFCIVWAGLGTVLRLVVQPESFDGGIIRSFVSWTFITLPFGVAVYLAVVGVEHAVAWFVQAREREAQVARLSEQLTGARLAALQSQLNPHFLFNALNTVAVLVRDGERGAAVRVVEQLSGVLRRILNRGRDAEVPLGDELELVREDLAVEQARFSDRLRPVIDVDPATLAALVPAFALQHLVENAIRHGISRRTGAGRLTVRARVVDGVLELTVTDDGPGIAPDAAAVEGHGLARTRETLAALHGSAASLTILREEQGTTARMRLPLRVAPSGHNG